MMDLEARIKKKAKETLFEIQTDYLAQPCQD